MIPPSEDEKAQIEEQLLHNASGLKHAASSSEAYFKHYQSVICPDEADDAVIQIEESTLRTHVDVLTYAKILCENGTLSRDETTKRWFDKQVATATEIDHIMRAVVNVTFMINCDERDYYPKGIDCGTRRAKWERNQSFLNFLETSFLPLQQSANVGLALGDQTSLKAWKLARRYGIQIRGTDNLLEHLLYDPRQRTLMIFHHAAYLRSHLRHSKDDSLDMGFAESLTLKTLPPRLLFETLLSLHYILFPIVHIGSKRSRSLLKKYIKAQNFDKEILWFECVRPVPPDFTFRYWGGRLEKLQEVTKRPPPRNSLVSWFERHTSERNALTVAILGLFLTVILGLLGVVVGVFQLVVAWLAWKDARA